MTRLFKVLLVSLSLSLTLPVLTTTSAVGKSGIIFGVNLDFSDDSVAAFNERLGQPVAAYGRFITFPLDQGEIEGLQRFIDEVDAVGGMAILTVEPSIPLDQVSEAEAINLAQRMALINAEGVSVLLRFAPEMNGNWHTWGQQPAAYTDAFRLVANAIHTFAPNTYMLWSPNYGSGYPFSGGSATPVATALDTDGDGALAVGDDPYAPYYPGDAYVDWVGLTLFYWGNSYPWGENEVPAADTFVSQIRGSSDAALPDFYGTYVTENEKPFAVFTAALVNPEAPGNQEAVTIKRTWWNQVLLAGRELLPSLQLVEWLEWTRPEPEAGNVNIDWSLTGNQAVRDAFLADLPELPVSFPLPVSASTPVASRANKATR